jgi:hypothetical protein
MSMATSFIYDMDEASLPDALGYIGKRAAFNFLHFTFLKILERRLLLARHSARVPDGYAEGCDIIS